MVHNPLNNRPQPALYKDKSDDLPVALQTVPKQLYVNSDQRLRRTEDVQRELILNRIKHKEFNPFLTSKKGQLYYKGVWGDPKAVATTDNIIESARRSASQSEGTLALPGETTDRERQLSQEPEEKQ